MDIWAWVHDAQRELRESGQERLAEILWDLQRYVSDGQHEQVDALIPEALALVRSVDHPWLEVFVRHWHAQSLIVDRCNVTQGLDEIVRLLDFAHGERTADCPQSVCVTQDFCIAHGVLDGPGYGEERLAASAEALARITPAWPCFECISTEHADALFDLGRFADAEAFLRRQTAACGRKTKPLMLVLKRAAALTELGRHKEALKILESRNTANDQKSRRDMHAQLKAREYAIANRLDDALAAHPAAADLDPVEFVRWWQTEQVLCAALPGRNDAQLGRTLRGFCNTLRDNGALYQQCQIALGAAQLALDRGRPRVAALHLEQVAEVLPRLRRPEVLAREHAALGERIGVPGAVAGDAGTAAADAVLEQLGDDEERNYELLLPARKAHPEHESLVLALCHALQEMGFPEHAVRELENFVLAQRASSSAFNELMRLLVRTGAEARLRELAEQVPEPMHAIAQFYLGRMSMRREDWAAAAQAFERTRQLEDSPNRSTLSNLALVYRHLDRLEESLALLDELAASEDDFSDDWDRMHVATLLGRHDKVRDSARRLGFKFEGEGPIDDPFEYCEVQLRDAVGRKVGHRAVRINPVVARIIAMQAPDKPCHYRDEVLVDPVVLNPREGPPPENASKEAGDYEPQYRGERVLKPGGYRIYDIDGVHPGEEAVEALRTALQGHGVYLSQRSGDGYRLSPREGETTVLGVYIFIAVPQGLATTELYGILAPRLAQWSQPITFRGLLRELGNETELERHEQIAQDLKL